MSTMWNPVGPERATVYWRRRLLVLVVLLALLLGIGFGLRALFNRGGTQAGSTPTAATTPSATSPSTSSASSSVTTSASAGQTCPSGQITVTATTDQDSYPGSSSPMLGLVIENVGSAPCSLDVGSGPLSLTVFSGNARIWSSDDCQGQARSNVVMVQPGKAGRYASRVTWNLQRSAAGCPSGQAKVGAGSYRLEARVGDLAPGTKSFTIS